MKKYIKIKLVDEKLIVCKKNITKGEQTKLQEYIDIRFKNSFSNLSYVLDRTYKVIQVKEDSIKVNYTNFKSFKASIDYLKWKLLTTPSHKDMLYLRKCFPNIRRNI